MLDAVSIQESPIVDVATMACWPAQPLIGRYAPLPDVSMPSAAVQQIIENTMLNIDGKLQLDSVRPGLVYSSDIQDAYQAHMLRILQTIRMEDILTAMRDTIDHASKLTDGKPTLVKTTLNLTSDEFAALKHLAVTRHASVSDVIRRAIILEKLLHDATRNGGKILLEEPDQPIKQLIIR
jgi:hypothetical protein